MPVDFSGIEPSTKNAAEQDRAQLTSPTTRAVSGDMSSRSGGETIRR